MMKKFITSIFDFIFNALGSLAIISGIVAVVSLIAYSITGFVMLLMPFMIAFLTLNFLFNK